MSEEEQHSGLNMPLRTLAAELGSVRLYNSLSVADSENVLPAKTVSEFVALGADAHALFMSIPNMGRKTAQELSDIVTDYLLKLPEAERADIAPSSAQIASSLHSDALISEIVGIYSKDVRLSNVFAQEIDSNPALKVTYAEWQKMPERVRQSTFLQLQNFGLRTYEELSKVILKFELDLEKSCSKLLTSHEAVAGLDKGKRLSELVLAYSDDVRLRRIFSSATSDDHLLNMSVAEWLAIPEAKRLKDFIAIPGLGKTAYAELKNAVHQFFTREKYDESDIRASAILDGNASSLDHKFLKLNEELIASALSRLSEKQKEVIRLRYAEGYTLEEVGKIYSVTRERIRQIEKKAIIKLRQVYKSSFKSDISELVFHLVWKGLAGNSRFINKIDFSEKRAEISYELKLACVALRGSVSSVISQYAAEFKSFWVIGYDLGEIENAYKKFLAFIAETDLPQTYSKVLENSKLPDELLTLSLLVNSDCHQYKGIINKGFVSIRKRRLAEIWLLFGREFGNGPVRLMSLHQRYVELCPEDQCDSRDILIVMQEYPKLFQRAGSLGWIMLSDTCPLEVPGTGGKPQLLDGTEEDGCEYSTNSKSLREILANILAEGPLPYKDIFEAVRIRSAGAYSKGSVAAILSTYPDFEFFGPGVIGLYSMKDNGLHILKAQKFLLEEIPIRQFIYSKIAGEPFVEYPGWTTEYFFMVAEKLMADENYPALGTLLSAVDLEDLPLETSRKEKLQEALSLTAARLELPAWSKTTFAGLSAERVLKSAWIAVKKGQFNWVLGNRICGERLDSLRVGPNVLMILVAAGVLNAQESWILSKNTEKDALSTLLEMTQSFQAGGEAAFWRHLHRLVSAMSPGGCFTASRKSEILELVAQTLSAIEGGYAEEVMSNTSPSRGGDIDVESMDDLLADELLRQLE